MSRLICNHNHPLELKRFRREFCLKKYWELLRGFHYCHQAIAVIAGRLEMDYIGNIIHT